MQIQRGIAGPEKLEQGLFKRFLMTASTGFKALGVGGK